MIFTLYLVSLIIRKKSILFFRLLCCSKYALDIMVNIIWTFALWSYKFVIWFSILYFCTCKRKSYFIVLIICLYFILFTQEFILFLNKFYSYRLSFQCKYCTHLFHIRQLAMRVVLVGVCVVFSVASSHGSVHCVWCVLTW